MTVNQDINHNELREMSPYAMGYEAYCDNQDETDNPYPHATDAHLSWNDGYSDAASDREEQE